MWTKSSLRWIQIVALVSIVFLQHKVRCDSATNSPTTTPTQETKQELDSTKNGRAAFDVHKSLTLSAVQNFWISLRIHLPNWMKEIFKLNKPKAPVETNDAKHHKTNVTINGKVATGLEEQAKKHEKDTDKHKKLMKEAEAYWNAAEEHKKFADKASGRTPGEEDQKKDEVVVKEKKQEEEQPKKEEKKTVSAAEFHKGKAEGLKIEAKKLREEGNKAEASKAEMKAGYHMNHSEAHQKHDEEQQRAIKEAKETKAGEEQTRAINDARAKYHKDMAEYYERHFKEHPENNEKANDGAIHQRKKEKELMDILNPKEGGDKKEEAIETQPGNGNKANGSQTTTPPSQAKP